MKVKLGFIIVSCLLATVTFAANEGKGKNFKAPRTEFGHPELRGVWNFSSNTPLQRPSEYADREFLTQAEVDEIHARNIARSEASDNSRGGGVGGYNQFWVESLAQDDNYRTSLIVDPPNGQLPPMVKGAVVQRGGLGPDTGGDRPVRFRVGGIRKDGPEDRGLSERCLMGFNSGPPFMPSMYNNNVQIFQTEKHVVILTEMIHDARVVPIDKRPRVDGIERWSGESRGWWDGDTLVVETKQFTDKIQSFRSAGIANNMTLTEYFTRTGPDNVEYKFTVNDPTTFTQPITVLVPMVCADGDLYEYACHEGNYGMFNILSGARREEAE